MQLELPGALDPMLRAARAANRWAERRPLTAAVAVGGTKNCLCDLAVQSKTEDSIDWRRSLTFTAFGFGYVGAVQWMLFNRAFPSLLPALYKPRAERTWRAVVGAVSLDTLVHMPFMYLPTFYTCRELAHSPSAGLAAAIANGMRSYSANFLDDLKLQCAIFVPVQLFNFGFSPAHLRVPTVVAAGVVWISALSLARGRKPDDDPPCVAVSAGSAPPNLD